MKKNGAGGCLFSRAELVEKWEIKSFFSRSNSVAIKKVFKDAC